MEGYSVPEVQVKQECIEEERCQYEEEMRLLKEKDDDFYEVPIVDDLTTAPRTDFYQFHHINVDNHTTSNENVTKETIESLADKAREFVRKLKDINIITTTKSNTNNVLEVRMANGQPGPSQPTVLGKALGKSGKKPKKMLKCEDCDRIYSSSYSLRKHRLIHTGQEPFQCDICSKKFTRKNHIEKHLLIHSNEKKYQCQECLKRFTCSGHLKAHAFSHSDEKQFECDICFKRFTLSSNLKTHKVLHTITEKQYQCELCKKRFSRPYHLKDHMLLHGDRPFGCNICRRKFTTEYHLKKHQSYHTDDRDLQCSLCSRTFIRLGDLKRHERTHSGEKPFQCTLCPKSFSLAYTLRRHQIVHEDRTPPEQKRHIKIKVDDPDISQAVKCSPSPGFMNSNQSMEKSIKIIDKTQAPQGFEIINLNLDNVCVKEEINEEQNTSDG